MVGNPRTNELLGMKRVAFKRFTTKEITVSLPDDFSGGPLELHLICDSYIGLDQCYSLELGEINRALNKGIPMQVSQSQELYQEQVSTFDPEIDYEMQPQNLPGGRLAEDDDVATIQGEPPGEERKYQSLFLGGFASYDQFQNEIIDDVKSDDGGCAKSKKQKKKAEESDEQINSNSKPEDQAVERNIEAGIAMLLDSDEDEVFEREMRGGQDDGMIEKDMDNFF